MADIDRYTGEIIDNERSALQALDVIFSTRIGSMVLLREFGAGVVEVIGRLVRPELLLVFQQLVITAIDLWEPRFRVRQIVFTGSVDHLRQGIAQFSIEVDFRPRAHLGDFSIASITSFALTFDGKGIRAL